MSVPRKSNFDLTGEKLVKRGFVVSYHGLRYQVVRVRLGTVYARLTMFGRVSAKPYTRVEMLDCNSVQVVQ